MSGWTRPASIPDLAAQLSATVAVNSVSDSEKPVELWAWPWDPPEVEYVPPTDDELATALAAIEADTRRG